MERAGKKKIKEKLSETMGLGGYKYSSQGRFLLRWYLSKDLNEVRK